MKKEFLDLGKQPITNSFLNKGEFDGEFLFNLRAVFDDETKLVSLKEFVSPEMMFNDVYAHRASESYTMRESFKKLANDLQKEYMPTSVLEIGSNDGVFIRHFNPDNTFAVEPCSNLAELTNDMGYKTYSEFWDTTLAKKLKQNHGYFDLIYSANTISHIEDLDEVFQAVKMSLSDDGIFIMEDPSLFNVMKNVSYDIFYDEHVHVFSVTALNNILTRNGLQIFRVDNLSVHGGSNRIYIKLSDNKYQEIETSVSENLDKEKSFGIDNFNTYLDFSERVKKSKSDLVSILNDFKKQGKKIISYGATYKSATIFNYCKIGTNLIDYVTDTTENKQGKYTPGMHIPIVSPEDGFDDTVDVAYLGAWNFEKEICEKESEFLKRGGKFVTHVPNVRVVEL
tara:strand:+ start:50 stop:1237 length:1188 start_codon:yes stop_codon:yes gene_type:complete